MAKSEIQAGGCGMTATVETEMDGMTCKLTITTDCPHIQALAAAMPEVEPFREISFQGQGPLTLKLAAEHLPHPACPVPTGIIKAAEVAAGLALPADATIKIER